MYEPTLPYGVADVYGDGSRIQEERQSLSVEFSQQVRAAARRQGISAAVLFHVAWALVVARTSAREDVVFGSVLSGRLQGTSGAQRTLGMFINTLPLRVRLSGRSVREAVEETQQRVVELLQHEQASLAQAQRCSGVGGGRALFSAVLNYRHSQPVGQQRPAESGDFAAGIQPKRILDRTSYPLSVSVDDFGEGVGFGLVLQADRRIEAKRVLGYLQKALQGVVEGLSAKDRAVLSVEVVPQAEQHEQLQRWNATAQRYPYEQRVERLFEEQVKRTPQEIAVVYEAGQYTYAQLEARANRIAHRLREQGVRSGQIVGVYLKRSAELIAALLGVLKAGGGYTLLDPQYPAVRLKHAVQEAQVRVLLTQESLGDEPWCSGLAQLRLDADERLTQMPSSPLSEVHAGAREVACVMFTSGSTGWPKGVATSHRALVGTYFAQRYVQFGAGEVFLQCSPVSWDAFALEVFGALLFGGRCVVQAGQKPGAAADCAAGG